MSIQAANLYATVSVAGAENSVGQLRNVSNAANSAQSSLSKLGANAGQVAKGVGQVAGGLVRVGEYAVAALAATGVAAEKVTMGFASQMELIHTQAGASQAEVIAMSKQVMDIVHLTGTAPDELAKGLYHIESVGLRGAEALDVLKASALGAKMGLADMESMSNALTAVSKFGSGIGGVKDMTAAMATLNAIVGVGNMRMQDLAESFGTGILGTSKTFGVGLRELGSALAVLTDAGVPANNAATRLSMTFTHMAAPTAAAIKVFTKLGLSQFSLAQDLRSPDGIFVAFKDLHDHLVSVGELVNGTLTPQGTADVSKIFGGSRFGATAMQLLEQMDRIKLKYDQIGDAQASFAEKLQQTMGTTRFKWGQFLADLKDGLLTFGQGIDASVGRGIGRLDDLLMSHMDDIRRMGVEAGHAIDGIDWTKVEHGAETFIGWLKAGWAILSKIPPELDVIAAGFLGINKLSGGLIGSGISNIVGGLGKGISNILLAGLSSVPFVGGALGAATATRVYVVGGHLDGMGPGGGLPNILGGGAGAAGAAEAGIGMTVGAAAAALAAGAGLGLIMAGAAQWIIATGYDPYNVKGRTGTATSRGLPPGGMDPTFSGPRSSAPYGSYHAPSSSAPFHDSAEGHAADTVASALIQFRADERASWTAGITAMNALTTAMTTAPWLKKLEDSWRKAGQTMHDRITEAITGLTGPHAGKAAAFLGSHLGNAGFGAGGYDQALKVIALLESLNSKDPGVAKAIRDLEARLPRLKTDKDDLAKAIAVAQGTDPKNVKLDTLNGIMADLRAHGDKTTRAKVQDLINAVKHQKLHVKVNLSPEMIELLSHSGAGPNATIKVLQTRRVSGTVSEFAAGGAYPAGVPRIVGEEGPELDIPTGPGYVFNREQTKSLARALGPSGGLLRALAQVRNATARSALSHNLARSEDRLGQGGKLEVDVRPQPIRFVVDGRTLLSANVLSTAFVRG